VVDLVESFIVRQLAGEVRRCLVLLHVTADAEQSELAGVRGNWRRVTIFAPPDAAFRLRR
jgi:hypothetical protein